MNRRKFIKGLSLATASIPFVGLIAKGNGPINGVPITFHKLHPVTGKFELTHSVIPDIRSWKVARGFPRHHRPMVVDGITLVPGDKFLITNI